MAHERYNADWVEKQGVGLVVRSFAGEIAGAVRDLLAPENYARFQRRAANTRNTAVYEIPELLDGILSADVKAWRQDPESNSAARFRPDSARSV